MCAARSREGWITGCHDVSDGGVAVALAEMALAGNVGALIDGPLEMGLAASFFAEDQGLYLATLHDRTLLGFLAGARAIGLEAEPIGRTIAGTRLIFELAGGDHIVTLGALREAHEGWLPGLMAGQEAAA